MVGEPGTRAFAAVVEVSIALAAVIALAIVASYPFVPVDERVAFTLNPLDIPGAHVSHDLLRGQVDDLGLARRGVAIVSSDGSAQLVLEGVDEGTSLAAVMDLIEQGGYAPAEPERGRELDWSRLVESDPRLLSWLMTVQAAFFLGAGLLLARLRLERPPAPRMAMPAAVALGVGGGLIVFGANLALGLALEAVGWPVAEQAWIEELLADPASLRWVAAWIVLFGPLAEEVFFRGYVLRLLDERAGSWTALVVSSTLFALPHFNLSGFPIYLMIGAALGGLYRRSGRLLAPILAHVVANGLVVLHSATAG